MFSIDTYLFKYINLYTGGGILFITVVLYHVTTPGETRLKFALKTKKNMEWNRIEALLSL